MAFGDGEALSLYPLGAVLPVMRAHNQVTGGLTGSAKPRLAGSSARYADTTATTAPQTLLEQLPDMKLVSNDPVRDRGQRRVVGFLTSRRRNRLNG